MGVQLLDALGVSRQLTRLIHQHDEIHMAVAWGFNGPVADRLLNQPEKIRSVTFGIGFCQTDPDLIDRLVGVRNTYVATMDKGTFHPKLYYFRSSDIAEAIIGSSNFTRGGLGTNCEASVHIKGPSGAPVFKQIREELDRHVPIRRRITAELAASYRLQFFAAQALPRPKNPVLPSKDPVTRRLASPLVTMTWEQYARAAKSSPHHDFDERLDLLRRCQTLFASVGSFASLATSERKAIAGVIGHSETKRANLDDHDWAWFGSMKGAGKFANRIAENDDFLAAAIDSIPRHGDVTDDHFKTYCKYFRLAFRNSGGENAIATATRLLAVKRPDTFVCVSEPNRKRLCEALNIKPSSLDLKKYWDLVIEPIRMSDWYNAARPTGKPAQLWDGRAAMLDAIYYEP
ncbi:phospholipase D family protein [Paracoccus sp. Z330]|uniref:Phospholipase D family protein n=1 Tax=Paracoccus onchidii TaxID=3017813 RepID=A0ABT4ZL63_9RHOB|nr:phospholipase D family protein [Paracoccus onchidii]MDB6179491.1 phospholipase D family protein [Paracoccus onchidii]